MKLLTMGIEHSRFTVLCWLAPLMAPSVIFKRKTLPKQNFPHDVIVQSNEKGFMNESSMLKRIRLV